LKILIYSYAFLPSLGGIEIVSATLAEQLVTLGHSVTVVTESAHTQKDNFTYRVVRQPTAMERIALIRSHDVVHANGASMALFFYAKLLGKPFLWTHGGYQLCCVDGLGWVDGHAAPLTPWASVIFHYKQSGLKFAVVQAFKLFLRRFAGQLANANVAITEWVAMRQPLPNQVVIYNPFPLAQFFNISRTEQKSYDFIYVGRLVSEKGVPDVIEAFAAIKKLPSHAHCKLALVGDGNWRPRLEALAKALEVANDITFFGKKSGKDLHHIIAQASIAVVPSVWEEPMGGVALELMAAGKNIIVTRNGGLYECAGKAALVYDNGNSNQLASCMLQLLEDPNLRQKQLQALAIQLQQFDPTLLTAQYVTLYQKILGK
jgi:glycosyltransferase involved in cell wall biosynthesis